MKLMSWSEKKNAGIAWVTREDRVEFVKFVTDTLTIEKIVVEFKELVGPAKMISSNTVMTDDDKSALILLTYKFGILEQSKLLKVEFNMTGHWNTTVTKEITFDYKMFGFIPKYITSNRGIVCLLDTTRQNYAVVQV
ncbi:unnamed protein product [Ambrosiozyma monospora]|uniref:Unnamed protein product n=1 Tax=Ambrosiozyma monospora TaxID=43982 RepID=A0ACB5U3A2_AMBMO|nr:unnamed protein product [Ambrosiozyma monospora]